MILEKGRPQSCEGRLDKEKRVYDLLDSLNIEYERVDHEAVDTMEACAEIDKLL
jgi:Ala-tRNA(Pro) deacylase